MDFDYDEIFINKKRSGIDRSYSSPNEIKKGRFNNKGRELLSVNNFNRKFRTEGRRGNDKSIPENKSLVKNTKSLKTLF